MHWSLWHASTAAAPLLLAIAASTTQAQVTASVSGVVAPSSTTVLSTCPSRSINYITQSLQQKCLTTSWTSKPNFYETATYNGTQAPMRSVNSPSGAQNVTIPSPILSVDTEPESSSLTASSVNLSTTTGQYQEKASITSTIEIVQQPGVTLEVGQDTETDSPLDNSNFLSFEEWKTQNLAKVGQSAENLGTRAGGGEPRRRPGGLNNALDSLGEDTEIEIDFRGFVNPGNSAPTASPAKPGVGSDGPAAMDELKDGTTTGDPSGVRRKGKDAGKTCKERSNYASFDCAATVLKTNPESKGSTAVLVENKDSYTLNICSAKNKFLIVELCDDILIDTVVLANFEFFSSMFRTFRVSVSDRYPVKLEKWKELGTFEARNSREVQAFLVENPLIWARYLRVEFLTHFGNEYYCPVSLLRVHGTTMMEEFNHDLKRAGTEEENDNEIGESGEGDNIDSLPGVVSAEALKEQAQETSKRAEQSSRQLSITSTSTLADVSSTTAVDTPDATIPIHTEPVPLNGFAAHNFSISKQIEELLSPVDDPSEVCRPKDRPADAALTPAVALQNSQPSASTRVANMTDPVTGQIPATNDTNTANVNNTASAPVPPPALDKGPSENKSEPLKTFNQTSASATKVQTSTQPPNANPTTQESFFKSVHKRLQLLESNSTLSLQYIEEQSRILRDAFSKVEKRQLAKTTTFLETLNTTVLTELRDFRNQYDQIWQSTVLELSSQREQSQHEVFALSARLSLLADEIVFQKRMAILQFILILLCLGLAIFPRSGSTTYLEFPPLVQNAISKSSANLSRYAPRSETPPASPSFTRPSSRYGLFRGFTHRRGPSDESQLDGGRDGTKSPSIEYSPPTPTSQCFLGDHGGEAPRSDGEEELSDGPPQAEASAARHTKSSPTTPHGDREEQQEFVEGPLYRSNASPEGRLGHGVTGSA